MFLSIDIGGSSIKYAVLNADFTIVKKWKKPTEIFSDSPLFYDYLCQNINTENIEAVGISSPGIISEDSTVLSEAAPLVSVMYRSNIIKEISKRLRLPVAAINDARAAGLCEVMMGNGKGTASSIYWLIGTGIGGAVFEGERLVRGTDNLAGEFSHLPVGKMDGKWKGISSYTSIPALLSIYKRHHHSASAITGEEIVGKYLGKEPAAVKAIDEWCLNIIQGLQLVTFFYNPEIICIGGGISEEVWFIEKIQELFNEQKHRFSQLVTTRILPCQFNNDANLIGAAIWAEKELKLKP